MAQPSITDVRPIDPILTNLSLSYRNSRFLWDQIAPPAKVEQKSGTFFKYTKDFWLRRSPGGKRGEDGRYTRLGYGVDTDTYKTVERGFEKLLDDPTRESSLTPESLEIMDLQYLTNQIQLELEKDVAAACFITGVWGTSNSLTGGSRWSDMANSDPIADADTAKRTVLRNTGSRPNVVFVGLTGWEKLKEHPLILDKYKYTQSGIMTEQLVAAALGMEKLVIGDSVENTAAEGATFVGADIWTDNALFVVQNDPGLGILSGAFTQMWPESGAYPWAAQVYRADAQRGNVTRVFNHYVPKIVASDAGYLYLDLVA